MTHADVGDFSGNPPRRSPTRRAPADPVDQRRVGFVRLLLLLLVALAAWLAVVAWREHRLTVAVRSLPRDVQEATYRRTYEELSAVCARESSLAEYCQRQAEFILKFPQCDAACSQLARRHFPAVWK